MQISPALYLQYAALSLLIVGGLVVSAAWFFVLKSADSAARFWFASVTMQLTAGMALFTVGEDWREEAYFVAAIIQFSSLYLALYSTKLMLGLHVKRDLLAIWCVHLSVFAQLHLVFDQQELSFAVAMVSATLLELIIVWYLRQVRIKLGLMPALFAEGAYCAAVLGGLTRLVGSWASGGIILYTDLSYYSVIAMSLQCVLIVMACFFYIGISIQRADARELAMRLEADQLRLRQRLAEDHARETQKLIGERDRMMILNSRFSAVNTMSLLGAGVVHEIAQPLQATRSAMEVLAMQQRLSEQELAQHTAGLLKLIERASSVVENLRRLIRDKTVDHEDVDCGQLLRRVYPIFASEAKRRSVEISLDMDKTSATKQVRANPVMLERVMFNLAVNALEAFDEPGDGCPRAAFERKLLIDIRHVQVETEECLVIGFHDTGHGVANNAYDQMFELLSSGKEGGIGLGLYLVKTLVESWNGTVKAQRNRYGGSGTSIEITLPAVPIQRRLEIPSVP
jgi:signal transduction histidine kinase